MHEKILQCAFHLVLCFLEGGIQPIGYGKEESHSKFRSNLDTLQLTLDEL